MLANVRLRVFAYPTEDEAKVRALLERLAHGAEVEESSADSAHGVVVKVMEARLGKRKAVESFFRGLGPELLASLAESARQRTDDSGHLHFRLDKQELVLGRIVLASGGDAVVAECAVHGPRSKAEENLKGALLSMLDPPP